MNFGENIECLLAFQNNKVNVITIVEKLISLNFRFKEKNSIILISQDFKEVKYETFLSDKIYQTKDLNCVFNFEGLLFDVNTDLSFGVNSKANSACISVPVNFIWDFDKTAKIPRPERFLSFVEICKSICEVVNPVFALLDLELFALEDFSSSDLANLESINPYNANTFTKEKMLSLYNKIISE